jgi:hypothetical protein
MEFLLCLWMPAILNGSILQSLLWLLVLFFLSLSGIYVSGMNSRAEMLSKKRQRRRHLRQRFVASILGSEPKSLNDSQPLAKKRQPEAVKSPASGGTLEIFVKRFATITGSVISRDRTSADDRAVTEIANDVGGAWSEKKERRTIRWQTRERHYRDIVTHLMSFIPHRLPKAERERNSAFLENVKRVKHPKDEEMKGMTRIWAVLAMVIVISFAGESAITLRDNRKIARLETKINQYENQPQRTIYGIKVNRIVDDNSLEFIPAELRSLELGKFTGDFCYKINKYAPRPGLVMCRLRYTDVGCFNKVRDDDGITWVKGSDGKAVEIGPNDTYKPWPICRRDDLVAQGGQ